ncbi:unnamed protein product [Chironomus riparius]|uniref:Uncharacterized protein n=1 Tax=Chironomus riparius TaxID=315576 RepID=A0A9N9S7N6_9DIPT|nr:unnamed protein product [Chironomus riparius]
MLLSYGFWIFIAISTAKSDDSSQNIIEGYASEVFYFNFDMNLWTFTIASESKILDENFEMPVNKSSCVKALRQRYAENTMFLPVKIDKVFPNLVVYEFNECRIQQIMYKNMKNLRQLQLINLEANQISTIPANTFNDTPIVKYLNLDKNQLTYIDEHVFSNLKNLQSLNLQQNKITFISKFAFKYLSELRKISLGDNLLQTLENAHFRNTRKLEKIFLRNNKIHSLSPRMFNGKGSLKNVDLKNNTCINGEFCLEKTIDERTLQYPSFVYVDFPHRFKPRTDYCEFLFDEMINKILSDC